MQNGLHKQHVLDRSVSDEAPAVHLALTQHAAEISTCSPEIKLESTSMRCAFEVPLTAQCEHSTRFKSAASCNVPRASVGRSDDNEQLLGPHKPQPAQQRSHTSGERRRPVAEIRAVLVWQGVLRLATVVRDVRRKYIQSTWFAAVRLVPLAACSSDKSRE